MRAYRQHPPAADPRAAARLAALLFTACAAAPLPALAQQDLPGMHYTLGMTAVRDDNLFRLPDGVAPNAVGLDTAARDDLILVPFVDIEGRWQLSRQQLSAGLRYSEDRYRRNPAYDDRTVDYRLDWRWALAQSWDGRLAVDRQQNATSLADYRGTATNLLTVRALHASANLRPRPDRRATLAFDTYLGENSLAARRISDYHISTARFELGASSALAQELWWSAARTEGRYPNRQIVSWAPIDNSYAQNDAALNARFAPSDATSLDLMIGHAWRRYDEVPQRDFSGPTGRLALRWEATAKLTLDAALAEELGAIDDYDRIYATTRSQSLGLTYHASYKVAATLGATRKRLRDRGDPDNALTRLLGSANLPDHEETRDEWRASLAWQPSDHLSAVLAWTHFRRDGNQAGLQYDANQQSLSLQYQW